MRRNALSSTLKTLLTLCVLAAASTPALANPGLGQAPTQQEISSQIIVNGMVLTDRQLASMGAQPGSIPAGSYWYDTATGAWGMQGSGTQGILSPGFSLGTLQANASGGQTGVFINGRNLPGNDLAWLQQTVSQNVPAGRYWCRSNGDCGHEGNPQASVNLNQAASQGSMVNSGGGYTYSVDGASGSCFPGADGETVCWDEGIGSSTY